MLMRCISNLYHVHITNFAVHTVFAVNKINRAALYLYEINLYFKILLRVSLEVF